MLPPAPIPWVEVGLSCVVKLETACPDSWIIRLQVEHDSHKARIDVRTDVVIQKQND